MTCPRTWIPAGAGRIPHLRLGRADVRVTDTHPDGRGGHAGGVRLLRRVAGGELIIGVHPRSNCRLVRLRRFDSMTRRTRPTRAMGKPTPERINHGAASTNCVPSDGPMMTAVGEVEETVTA